ncbi:hypothetical protein TELCIR_05263 [Teladorsagia circumcincta]|uniref:Uncharacterized protein n=1 Tax=Teladorsagia circumcincta TaxID=45464 RepID=A0A2G9URJ7_TELCI|nr:hypothetical protein TELCIR_05263 [Teladorsagia circumcincta]
MLPPPNDPIPPDPIPPPNGLPEEPPKLGPDGNPPPPPPYGWYGRPWSNFNSSKFSNQQYNNLCNNKYGNYNSTLCYRKLLVYDGLKLAWHGLDGLADLVLGDVLLCGRQLRKLLGIPVSHGVFNSTLEFIL